MPSRCSAEPPWDDPTGEAGGAGALGDIARVVGKFGGQKLCGKTQMQAVPVFY